MRFRSQPYQVGSHDVDHFDSGEPVMNEWLRRHAGNASSARTARTFVWCGEDAEVLAYCSLAAHVLARGTLPHKWQRGVADEVPAFLLARLAIHRRLHNRGHGGELLADALLRAFQASELVAAKYVVVDALHEKAARFYEHHGFKRIPGSMRLVQKMSDIAAVFRD